MLFVRQALEPTFSERKLRRNRAILHFLGEHSNRRISEHFIPKGHLHAESSEAVTPARLLEENRAMPRNVDRVNRKMMFQLPPTEIYEQLRDLNQHCTAAIDLLAIFSRKNIVPCIEGTYYRAMLEEARASINQNVTEHMNNHEISAAAKADRKRLRLERKLFGTTP
jgi:hypothetical protein